MHSTAVGAFVVALAILLGAFGAHALQGLDAARMRFWAIATDYHLIGGLGLAVLGLLPPGRWPAAAAFWLLALGILCFSGSLYGMALGAPRSLGMVTPIGGTCLILGWTCVGLQALSKPRS